MRRRTIITVGSGDAEVKIYTLHRKDGYSSFQAVWYELRQRKSKTFAKMEAAKLWAQQVSSSCRHELPVIFSVSPRTTDGWIAKRMIPYIEPNPRLHLFDPAAVKSALLAQFAIPANIPEAVLRRAGLQTPS